MDKKSEAAWLKRVRAARAAEASRLTAPRTAGAVEPSGWWMYHGDRAHTGYVSDSDIKARNVSSLKTVCDVELGGPVLSVPAVTDGYIYVGVANYLKAQGGNGGALHKVNLQGEIVQTFHWDLGDDLRDTHGFTGMGCTPAVVNGRVYFGAFNGKFYCLDQETLKQVWVTDLRNADPAHNQPVTNVRGGNPPAVMWSSPVVSADGTKLYVGIGEGENPELYSFVCCLDSQTGNLVWIFCTNLFQAGKPNQPNSLPTSAVLGVPPAGFIIVQDEPVVMGCSVWGSIAFDETLDRLYCPTGNQQPEPNGSWVSGPFNPELPSPGYSNGLLALDATTGAFKGFFQVPPESNYRVSDIDVDVGSSPVLFDLNGRRVVGFACKNGTYFWLDADTLEPVKQRQLLPYRKNGEQIPTVDPHPASFELNPHVTNAESNVTPGENYSGPFNTAAIHPGSTSPEDPISARLFIGMGGPNYHSASPGIDSDSTPFMRAIDATTLEDVWPMDDNDPPRYVKARPPMYTNAGESGLSSPTVVNDVVFCTTTQVAVYAFDVRDGTLLWQDMLGSQTEGYNGGYGYCIGAAVWKNYVVAGGLVVGQEGGFLRIYQLPT